MSNPTSLLQSRDVLINTVRRLSNIDVTDNVPNIQFPSLSIEMEAGPTPNRFIDARAYSMKFAPDLDLMAIIDSLAVRGQEYVSMLYSFRSISKAIPMLVGCSNYLFVYILFY